MSSEHGLTTRQMALIRQILAPYADRIERVDLFGSRAKGTQRPNSDVDLVLHGTLSAKDVDRIQALFRESSLPYSVDVKDYARIAYPPLREHIDRMARRLFTHEQLTDFILQDIQ